MRTTAKIADFDKIKGLQSEAIEIDKAVKIGLDFSIAESIESNGFNVWGGPQNIIPSIVDGRMVFYPDAEGACYVTRELKESTRTLESTFRLSSSDTGGSVVLIAWEQDFELTYPTIPESPCHLVITLNKWTYSTFIGGIITIIKEGELNLSADTDYSCSIYIDSENNRAKVNLPNGEKVIVEDQSIGIMARFACFELFKNRVEDSNGEFSIIKCSDGRLTMKSEQTNNIVVSQISSDPSVDIIVPTSRQNIFDEMSVEIEVGESGKILIEILGTIEHKIDSNVLWVVTEESAGALKYLSISKSIKYGNVSASVLLDNMQAGRRLNFNIQHFATVENSCNFKCSNGNGNPFVLKASRV